MSVGNFRLLVPAALSVLTVKRGRGDRTHIGHRPKLDSCIKNS